MRIKWRTLFGLGSLAWAILCTYDYLHGREFNVPKEDEAVVLEQSTQHEPQFIDDGGIIFSRTLLLCFLLGFGLFVIVAIAIQYLRMRYQKNSQLALVPIIDHFSHLSRIQPEPDIAMEAIIPNQKTTEVHTSKPAACQLRPEMVETSSTFKELATLRKRCEGLVEEKRNLTKRLAQSERDSREIKSNMTEMLREKNGLLRRLESATQKMRATTIAHQVTIGKLDESNQSTKQLKLQLEQSANEKLELQKRLRRADAKFKTLKKCKQEMVTSSTNIAPPVDASPEIQNIEMKLKDLECSVVQMKSKTEEAEVDEEDEVEEEPGCARDEDSVGLAMVSSTFYNLLTNTGSHILDPDVRMRYGAAPYQPKVDLMGAFGAKLLNVLFNVPMHSFGRSQVADGLQTMPLFPMVTSYQQFDNDDQEPV